MTSNIYDFISVENKWQKKWFEEKIYLALKKNNKKFFIHFAYPGVSGYLHVGHMRGFTYCDIIARYKKMNDYDVLFPAGFHASGIPSISFAKKVKRNDPTTIKILKEYGCNDDVISKLKDPEEVVKYFSDVYVNDYWKKFGYLIDYSRLMSTISEGYKKFIQWQFYKLNEKNLLIQKPHFAPFCPKCGPVAVDKSETDISKGGSAEILEFTIIKFIMEDGSILPAATLRPETIFGVTNMWVNPNVDYIKIKVGDEKWILSKEGSEKIGYQLDDVEIINETIPGTQLIGLKCKIPYVEREIPILPGPFADPNVATGIVMSVPAHAPYDYIALLETGEKIEPITIIDVAELVSNPAKTVCEQLLIKSQKETDKLDEATDIVYKKEFHKGSLNDKCREYSGIKISDIKDTVKNLLIDNNQGAIIREFSEDVICRCQEKVLIKQIPDQWFIKYSDNNLTNNSKKHIETMKIFPDEYNVELPKVLDWFDDRACIRQGSWLGAEFPFKKGWIIEPISDSTIYPLYYTISKYVNEGIINPNEMTESFFDYVFLGKGTIEKPVWDEIREEVKYWYPVDINLGGKEHKTVHFPVFIMNHVAIIPDELRPQGIFVHWWVTQKGKEKISKSKGGAEHIAQASKIYGIDAMRLYYSHVGSPFVDIEWDSETVLKYKNKIANIYKLIQQLNKIEQNEDDNLDNWLKSIINRRIQKITESFNSYNLRVAANEIFYEIQKDIQWYIKRGGGNKELISWFVESWIKLITPITPHLAEELWHESHEELVSTSHYPEINKEFFSDESEVGEYLLKQLIEDTQEIIKVTKISPKKIYLYTASNWKYDVLNKAIKLDNDGKFNIGILMKELMSDESLKQYGKEISKYMGKIPNEIKKLNDNDKKRYSINLNEKDYLCKSKDYLKQVFSCEIEIYNSDDKNLKDPEAKSKFSYPLRPAIYIE
jgi:leucyl-tRNA synthetase